MDYKAKLQTNNTALEGNNTYLQGILNTINNLPEATVAVDLDAEITEQENIIDQIQAALEGKAIGGDDNIVVDYVDVTINLELDNGLSINMISPVVNENGKIILIDETIINGATYRFPKINGLIAPFQLEITSINIFDSPTISIIYNNEFSLVTTSEYSICLCYCYYSLADHYSITLKGVNT